MNVFWKTSTGFWTTDITCGCACRSSTHAMPTKMKSEPEPPFWAPWKDSSHFKGVDLLPYHKLGIQKYAHLGRGYALDACAPINDECLSRSKAIFEDAGITVSVIRH